MLLNKKINLDNFPSFNDYTGELSEVNHGDIAIVLRKVGRPYKITQSVKWTMYDVYEILTKDIRVRQVFRYHIDLVEKAIDK